MLRRAPAIEAALGAVVAVGIALSLLPEGTALADLPAILTGASSAAEQLGADVGDARESVSGAWEPIAAAAGAAGAAVRSALLAIVERIDLGGGP